MADLPRKARILDLGCGSGRHSISLSTKGHDVIGIDASEAMIRHAMTLASETGVSPEFIVGNMLSVKDIVSPSFDLILCLGNSLALLPHQNDLELLLSSVKGLLKDDGSFIFQVLNFDEILTHDFRFFPIKAGKLSNGNTVIFTRFFKHKSEDNCSTLIAFSFFKRNGGWLTNIVTQKVLHLRMKFLQEALAKSGFGSFDIYSDYRHSPFLKSRDRNMVIRARAT